jgi:thiamine-monophosphate kinase
MSAVAASYDCPLIGGDISIWDHPLLLSVTILAELRGVEPVLRSGAKAGDLVYVTGALGGSLVELDEPRGYVHHLDFEPRLKPARALAADPLLRPRCMMDLSDGLGMDLPRICRMAAGGEAGAVIDVASLPLSRGAVIASQRSGRPAWQHALGDGEDYELLLVVSPETAGRMPRAIEGVPLTRIGEITHGSGVTLRMPDGHVTPMAEMGWQHHD